MTTATSVSAGISQSQSMLECRPQTMSAAASPAASSGSARCVAAAAAPTPPEQRGEQRHADEAQLREGLELERVRVLDGLVQRAFP
jgi:hypothetical protein